MSFIFPLMVDAEELRIITFAYPPFMTAEKTGMVCDIVNGAAGKAGLTLSMKVYPRKRAKKVFRDTDTVFFLGESRYFPELQGRLESRSLMYSRVVLVCPAGGPMANGFNRLSDGAGYRVGLSLGSNLISVFEQSGWHIQTVRVLESNFKKLMAGRIDCWATVDLTAMDIINKYEPENAERFRFYEIEKFKIEFVSKKTPENSRLYKKFCDGFETLRRSGEYETILESFYGTGNVPASVYAD